MPVFTLFTNVSIAADKKTDLLQELSSVLAKALGKPELFICIHIKSDESISFGGNTDPAAFGVLKSIGGVGGKHNNNLSAELFPIIQKELGIPGNRIYIEFVNLGANDIAFNGHTFA